MSCSICLLPFVPAPKSTAPRPPPRGILTPQQGAYLQTAYGLGTRIMGTLSKYDYLDNNMFGGSHMMFLQWEGQDGTFFMMHVTCAKILQRIFDAESMNNVAGLVRLLEIEEVLGRPQTGIYASRLRFVPYEDAGSSVDRVDIQSFWKSGHGRGLNTFLWKKFSQSDAKWALAKPDVFPRFFPQIKPERIAQIGTPVPQPGILTGQPLDVLLALLPYLPISTYLALTSTCRLLRRYALTTFQPYARTLVLDLGWAMPLIALGEYDAAVKGDPSTAQALAHPELSPASGDWLLYLSHVHRTTSMRARRRIWNICVAVRRVVIEKLPSSNYGQNLEVEREKLEENVTTLPKMIHDMKGLDKAGLRNLARELIPRDAWQRMGLDDNVGP